MRVDHHRTIPGATNVPVDARRIAEAVADRPARYSTLVRQSPNIQRLHSKPGQHHHVARNLCAPCSSMTRIPATPHHMEGITAPPSASFGDRECCAPA